MLPSKVLHKIYIDFLSKFYARLMTITLHVSDRSCWFDTCAGTCFVGLISDCAGLMFNNVCDELIIALTVYIIILAFVQLCQSLSWGVTWNLALTASNELDLHVPYYFVAHCVAAIVCRWCIYWNILRLFADCIHCIIIFVPHYTRIFRNTDN